MKTPFVLKSDRVAYFDVDDTLVSLDCSELTPTKIADGIAITPYEEHVAALKEHFARGHAIVVWSQGGHAWAEKVVRELGLAPFVDVIMTKPAWHYDDLPCTEWMGQRVYKLVKDVRYGER